MCVVQVFIAHVVRSVSVSFIYLHVALTAKIEVLSPEIGGWIGFRRNNPPQKRRDSHDKRMNGLQRTDGSSDRVGPMLNAMSRY